MTAALDGETFSTAEPNDYYTWPAFMARVDVQFEFKATSAPIEASS